MEYEDFLGANYSDLFDTSECNFILKDSLNDDWLESIFSSSVSSSHSSPASALPMTGIDDVSPGTISQDSGLHNEHSYSIGSGGSSPSLDSWTSANENGDSFDFLKDFGTTAFDLNSDLPVVENDSLEAQCFTPFSDDKDLGRDLDRWMDASFSPLSSSSSSSSGVDSLELDGVTAAESGSSDVKPTKKNIVLFTDVYGQVLKFTSEDANTNEELVLVDFNYNDSHKDPIDLSVCKSNISLPLVSEGGSRSHVFHQILTPSVDLCDISCSWEKDETQLPRSYTLTEALFSNPAPTEGLLLLTDEEKNTLAAEGYPVPTKLPIGKVEEKYLKKIRRKIKNKISAQESRRKKKEYVDDLELKMHRYYQENTELLKKVEQLENTNKLLVVQLHKFMKSSGSAPSVGGTRLMVLVLFFAAFLGSWSPISWSIGYGQFSMISVFGASNKVHMTAGVNGIGAHPMPCVPPAGPDLQHPMVDIFNAVSTRSRLLIPTKDEDEAAAKENDSNNSSVIDLGLTSLFGPIVPASYLHTIAFWLTSVTSHIPGNSKPDTRSVDPVILEEQHDAFGFPLLQIQSRPKHSQLEKDPATLKNTSFSLPSTSEAMPPIGQTIYC